MRPSRPSSVPDRHISRKDGFLGLQVLVTEGLWVPLVHIQGVYILPGIPRLFQQMVSAHQDRFNGPPFLSTALYTHMGEGDLAGGAPSCFRCWGLGVPGLGWLAGAGAGLSGSLAMRGGWGCWGGPCAGQGARMLSHS